jgi:hypothetical protein
MTQDQFPPPESADQEPQIPPQEPSGTIPEPLQPELPTDNTLDPITPDPITPDPITPEPTLAELESLRDSRVGSQESGVEESVIGEPALEASGSGNRKSGGEGLSPPSEKSAAQTLQEAWERVRPGLQTQTIKALRGTIQLLEGIVERLEESEAPVSEKRSENMPPTSETVPDKLVPPFLTDELPEKFRSIWQRLQRWWATVLPQIRSRLPESLKEKFSDRALTGAIVTVLVLFLWIVPGLFSSQPKPSPVAKAPPVQKVTPPAAKPTIPPQISTPEPAQPVAPKPTEDKPAPQVVKVSPAPVAPSPVPPPPPLKLTPEQKLIARIQDQVAEISNQYVNGLIQSVQANFRSSQLTVKVGNGWYGLSQPQQNKLADEMLGRMQELDFSKLEITDIEGTLLARSPVVGSEMIILKREREGVS